ncbi:hypothetical protein ACFSTC_48780 [Nonomuraea ferruginea]
METALISPVELSTATRALARVLETARSAATCTPLSIVVCTDLF